MGMLAGTLWNESNVDKGLQLARECKLPDAVWFASLFPAGVAVTKKRMREVMLQQGNDARALYIAWTLADDGATELLERATQMSYAPAQAAMAWATSGTASFEWAEKAAARGDRVGLFNLARCFLNGLGCVTDAGKATELYKQAAYLEHPIAMFWYGDLAFSDHEWERYVWWGRASTRGFGGQLFAANVVRLLPLFEKDELCLVLHTVAPVIRARFDVSSCTAFNLSVTKGMSDKLRRILELHEAMLQRARRAIDCWSVVSRRCGLVKDVRLVVAKMVWKDAWRWGETRKDEADVNC
jgi:hypothetical protein